MIDGLGCRGGHTPFVQTGEDAPYSGTEAVKPDPRSSWEGHSGWMGAGFEDESTESCGIFHPLRIPLAIDPACHTYVVVVI